MKTIRCDGCGHEIALGSLRYSVSIDVRAAYDDLEVGLNDLVRDHRSEMIELIERLQRKSVSEIEESVYKGIKLDLCPPCQRVYLRDPLRFQPDNPPDDEFFDVDGFLRSLGYGGGSKEEAQ